MLPRVSKVATPVTGACQVYHTDLPPRLPACKGSPGSAVALVFSPPNLPLMPEMLTRLAKLSAPAMRGTWLVPRVRTTGAATTVPSEFSMSTEYVPALVRSAGGTV